MYRRDARVEREKGTRASAAEFVDGEAKHSGDETSEGSDDGDLAGVGNKGDEGFLNDEASQASSTYDQQGVYMQSLRDEEVMAGQPATTADVEPAMRFAGAFARMDDEASSTSSASTNEYEIGSFVVEDEDIAAHDVGGAYGPISGRQSP